MKNEAKDRMLQKEITKPLLDWYDANRRVLPWREEPAPYNVWVSEIMLQQTRVEAVIPYYRRFLRELPDICALAAVSEERLLKLWEGLGYYSRARNLKKGAQQVMAEYNGMLPSEPELLLKIAGIGPYTAAAIASIAYGVKIPAVDGNLLRVYARLSGYEEDVRTPAAKKCAETAFLEIFPPGRAGEMNQALMDLGAMVCLPNGVPRCDECPVRIWCYAKSRNCVEKLPKPKEKKERPVQKRTVLLIRKDGAVLVQQRPKKGLLAGMYEFPNPEGSLTEEEVMKYCGGYGIRPCEITDIRPLAASRHIFTHLVWEMTGYEVKVCQPEKEEEIVPVSEETEKSGQTAEKEAEDGMKNGVFLNTRKIAEEIAIPSAFRAYIKLLKR